jgi:membrane protease subunit (stomatin/prohibitin family)
MKVGDPVMRVFARGDNWIGVITWLSVADNVVQVKWTHKEIEEVHHISILTEVLCK